MYANAGITPLHLAARFEKDRPHNRVSSIHRAKVEWSQALLFDPTTPLEDLSGALLQPGGSAWLGVP